MERTLESLHSRGDTGDAQKSADRSGDRDIQNMVPGAS